jgi:hypothetical protein
MKKILLLSALIILVTTVKAQDVAMVNVKNIDTYENKSRRSTEVIPVLEETEYTYKYNNDEVLVTFKDGEHIEYFNNKKYYIKSKLEWITNEECYMTIQESNLPDFPFNKGSKLHMKILKVKNGKVFYESTLGGRTWSGKMKVKEKE